MHVVHINFHRVPECMSVDDVFERWPSLADVAEAVAGSGIRVSVLQAAPYSECRVHNGIDYHFIDVDAAGDALRRSRAFARTIADIRPDVLHVHGLGFAADASALAQSLLPSALPIVLQDHADRLPNWWRRSEWRRRCAVATGVSFTSLDQARAFTRARLFDPSLRLFEIPESSSHFTPGDRASARAETGLHGDPCVLWIGRLNRGKDPMTVLEGVARAALRLPGMHLWCAFGAAPMLAEVQARVGCDQRLTGRVHLMGNVPHARIETLLRAADLFVSGSRAEGSGYAAIEAIACGIAPVLTDIPAFRALTGNGRIGKLWPCGDPAHLADALHAAATNPQPPARVRAHFDAELSFTAVGRRWADAYAQVLEGWRRRAA